MDAPNNPTESGSTKARVLIVLEGEKDRFLLKAWLTQAEFHCETASNGEEALGILGKQEFDVLICDWGPPAVPGLALLEAAREKYPRMSCMFAADTRKLRCDNGAKKLGEELDLLWQCFRGELDQLYCAPRRSARGFPWYPGDKRTPTSRVEDARHR